MSGCPRVSVETKKELMRREVEIKLACGDSTGNEVGPKPIKLQSGQRKFRGRYDKWNSCHGNYDGNG